MDWKAAIGAIAPTVATALGGPLAGLAVDAVGSALGWTDTTKEKVEDAFSKGQMTGDQILALKQAEIALVAQEKELGFKFSELEYRDRQGARDMQTATKSYMPAVLSALVTIGYFSILIGMMRGALKVDDSQALLIMLGSLGTAWGAVMAFWFGSTHGSAEKTRLLAASPPTK
jgi:hypothetical protein